MLLLTVMKSFEQRFPTRDLVSFLFHLSAQQSAEQARTWCLKRQVWQLLPEKWMNESMPPGDPEDAVSALYEPSLCVNQCYAKPTVGLLVALRVQLQIPSNLLLCKVQSTKSETTQSRYKSIRNHMEPSQCATILEWQFQTWQVPTVSGHLHILVIKHLC